jgi:hypothetical protein
MAETKGEQTRLQGLVFNSNKNCSDLQYLRSYHSTQQPAYLEGVWKAPQSTIALQAILNIPSATHRDKGCSVAELTDGNLGKDR